MDELKVKLPDLCVYAHWADAPVGALVQVYLPDISAKSVTGFRCNQSRGAHEQPLRGLLLLSGDTTGKMISGEDDYISYGIDVSHVLEICVGSLSPSKFNASLAKSGDAIFVLSHNTLTGAVLVVADLPQNGRFGYVRVDAGAQSADATNWLPDHPRDGKTKLAAIGKIALMPKLERQLQTRTP